MNDPEYVEILEGLVVPTRRIMEVRAPTAKDQSEWATYFPTTYKPRSGCVTFRDLSVRQHTVIQLDNDQWYALNLPLEIVVNRLNRGAVNLWELPKEFER